MRASVNISAMGMLESFYVNSERVPCLSHTISNAGKALENVLTVNTYAFVSKWINIIGRSAIARNMFRDRTNLSPKRANLTRWYAKILSLVFVYNVCI
jgi:hypothetical protein